MFNQSQNTFESEYNIKSLYDINGRDDRTTFNIRGWEF